MPNGKQHAATEESLRCWPMTKTFPSMLVADTCPKPEKDTALALRCIEKDDKPRRSSGNCNFNYCQWGAVRLRKYRSMRESEATTYGWKMKALPAWDVQKSETKVRGHPSGNEGRKISSLRELDGPLSHEERRICKTLPEVQPASCAPRRQRQRRRRVQGSCSQSKVHQRLIWQPQTSLDTISKLSWYGWRNKWRNSSVQLKSKWPKLPQCYD